VNECQASQTARVTSNLHASSSTMAVSRVPSPPLPEVNTPVAENWCYTQVNNNPNPNPPNGLNFHIPMRITVWVFGIPMDLLTIWAKPPNQTEPIGFHKYCKLNPFCCKAGKNAFPLCMNRYRCVLNGSGGGNRRSLLHDLQGIQLTLSLSFLT